MNGVATGDAQGAELVGGAAERSGAADAGTLRVAVVVDMPDGPAALVDVGGFSSVARTTNDLSAVRSWIAMGIAPLVSGVPLLAGAVLRGWYWWGLLIGAAAGVLLVHWLILQSLYRIGALCPYCMVVWVVTMTIFVAAVTSLRRALRVPPSIIQYAPSLLVAWTLVVAALIAVRFWDYWSTLV